MSLLALPSTETAPAPGDAVLCDEILAHLEVQLHSARGLLAVVLEQGVAIRARDVQEVVATTGRLQAELARRGALEDARAALLARAGARLSIDPTAVTIELLTPLMDSERGALARERSAELRGLLSQVQREHHVNRVLMNHELQFLDHLLRLADPGAHAGYDQGGGHARAAGAGAVARHRTLDLAC